MVILFGLSGLMMPNNTIANLIGARDIFAQITTFELEPNGIPNFSTLETIPMMWPDRTSSDVLVVNRDIGRAGFIRGSANGQGVWGGTVSSGPFARAHEGGGQITLDYGATFTKNNPAMEATARISNTALSLIDFGSQSNAPTFAEFNFQIYLSHAGNRELFFSDRVTLSGRNGRTNGTLNNGDVEPFILTNGPLAFGFGFPGTYTEDGNAFSIWGASYVLDTYPVNINLNSVGLGEEFSLQYSATLKAIGQGGESEASVRFWDPLGTEPFFNVTSNGLTPGPGPAPVPEPGTFLLLGSGLLGLGFVQYRRRKKG